MPDYDRMRAERDFNVNPPTNAPGQGGDGWGDLFDSPTEQQQSSPMSGDMDINNILNGSQGAYGVQGMQGNMQGMQGGIPGMPGVQMQGGMQGMPGMQQQENFGDKVSAGIDTAAIATAKGIHTYAKYMKDSFANNTSDDWNALGGKYFKLSGGILAGGILLWIFSNFFHNIHGYFPLMFAGVFGMMIGVVIAAANKRTGKPAVEETPQVEDVSQPAQEDTGFSWDDTEEDSTDSFYDESDEEEDNWDGFDDSDDYGRFSNEADSSFFANSADFNVEDAVKDLPDIPAGQYTRQYLFETFTKILPIVNPGFMNMESVSGVSDEFLMFEDYLIRSAQQTGAKEEKLDELQMEEMHRNLFLIRIIATRPTGLKEQEIAEGIADLYKRDEYGTPIEGREGVFGRVNSQVGRLIIDIFLSNTVMVSLGDVFRQKKDFLLDTKNVMPLIWGVSEMGKVFYYDGMKDGNGGMLISGEARSGKSWKGQSLIAQMCMFRSPKELNFYFYDVKGIASDYSYLSKVLPHCKGFCGDALRFNESIEGILKREAKRRTNLLAGKYTNVKDYNKDHPYEQIPTIYFVIDEMATAMSEMKSKDVEIRKHFDELLIQIATKYPYLEIKLLLFPHRIVNDIINKTVSSMISTRSVMGNVPSEELKNALDVKNFPYSLVKTGDMAVKSKSINNGNVVYSHSEVLSTDEQTNRKIFDFIGAVWGKLEPDCVSEVGNENTAKETDKGTVNRTTRTGGRDNSLYKEDFSYHPESGTSSGYVDVNSAGGELINGSDDVDESFWDEELSNEEEDSFWDNF